VLINIKVSTTISFNRNPESKYLYFFFLTYIPDSVYTIIHYLNSLYKVFLNTLVATSWNAFAGDIAAKSRDAIKLHQEKYNANSVIPHNVLASDYLTDCHQALFFQKETLVY